MKNQNRYVAEMVEAILTDEEIIAPKREQIEKALRINSHHTSCWMLQVAEVQDILGKDSKDSGWYITLSGTRCGVKFFINNDMEIIRKPNKDKVEVKHTYSLYNDNHFFEGFWTKHF